MSNKPIIHIVHLPTGALLCEDGNFRSCISSCFCKTDTMVYRSVGAALRRLNSVKPGRKIRADVVSHCALDVVEANYGSTGKTYLMDRFGKILCC